MYYKCIVGVATAVGVLIAFVVSLLVGASLIIGVAMGGIIGMIVGFLICDHLFDSQDIDL